MNPNINDVINRHDDQFETNQCYFEEHTPTGGLFLDLEEDEDELALHLAEQSERIADEVDEAEIDLFGADEDEIDEELENYLGSLSH